MEQFSNSGLAKRRKIIESQWTQFVAGKAPLSSEAIRRDIIGSWQRSAQTASISQAQAPADDAYTTSAPWKDLSSRQR